MVGTKTKFHCNPSSAVCVALVTLGWLAATALPARAQQDFITFETVPTRPVTLSPDGNQLFVTNIPDSRLEIFNVSAGGLAFVTSVQVGLEPIAVAAHTNDEVWVVNNVSDSVSIIDLTTNPPHVSRTLLVGDEPMGIVFAGSGGNRAFISTAHRGQHRTHSSISGTPGAGDPQYTTEGIGRADVWVFDALGLGSSIGGTPIEILTFFGDSPRGIAAAADGSTVCTAIHQSGNQTTAIIETSVCNGFDAAGPGPSSSCPAGAPGGVVGPDDDVNGIAAPETSVIVKFDPGSGRWLDSATPPQDWSSLVRFNLPDLDVHCIDANTLAPGSIVEFASVGTINFDLVFNPVSGKIYVTNIDQQNHVRFEGAGLHGGTTVQGNLAHSRITVLDPAGPSVDAQHLNQHIQYNLLHTDAGANHALIDAQIPHSLSTPLQAVVSSDGSTVYMAAFGSSKIGVFASAALEDPNFETNFDPTVESANYLQTDGGPAGLALDETNGRLYVLTRFSNSVSSIDTTTGSTLQTIALHNPEPLSVVEGRPFLYDAVNTSGNGEAACASCHMSGDMDGQIWNLGDPDLPVTLRPNPQPAIVGGGQDFHGMKGPMTTQTLRGLKFSGGQHWRGDRTNGENGIDLCNSTVGAACSAEFSFNNFIVAFEGLIGHEGLIASSDMQKFTDFALEIVHPPNPVRALDNTLNASQAAGRALWDAPGTDAGVLSCNQCHELSPIDGFFGTQGAQSLEGETQEFKIPHNRNDYRKIGMFGISASGGVFLGDQVRGSGFLHDGTVDTMKNFLSSSVFVLTPTEEDDLEQLLLAFASDLAPMVGQQVTLDSTNSAVVGPRIDAMITASGDSFESLLLGGISVECDLIVKGTVGGTSRGWLRLASGLFQDDLGNTNTDAQVRAFATSDGPLTYTCVPPGSGLRMGTDRDRDELGDGVETNTGIFVDASNTGTDPANADTDGDGFSDGVEVAAGTDPNNPNSDPVKVPTLNASGLLLTVLSILGSGFLLRRRRRIEIPAG
jgi:YVTN family beta-propeller protein